MAMVWREGNLIGERCHPETLPISRWISQTDPTAPSHERGRGVEGRRMGGEGRRVGGGDGWLAATFA